MSLNYVLALSEKGFRKDLIENAIIILQQEITELMAVFSFNGKSDVVEDYQVDSDWISFAKS